MTTLLALSLSALLGTSAPAGAPPGTPLPSAAAALPAPAGGLPAPATAIPAPAAAAPLDLGGGSWSGPAAALAVLALLGAAAIVLVRRRGSPARLVEVIETTSLGPRRALVVARVNGQLLLLGSSEAGIAVLTTAPAELADARRAYEPGPAAGLLGALRLATAPARTSRGEGFESLLTESTEDLELRRKLAAGQSGSVR